MTWQMHRNFAPYELRSSHTSFFVQLPILLCYAGGIEFEWDQTGGNWPAKKAECTFGQLPFVEHGDLKIAQRYLYVLIYHSSLLPFLFTHTGMGK